MAFPHLIIGLGHGREVGRNTFAEMLEDEFKRRNYETCRLAFAVEAIDDATFRTEVRETERPVAFIVSDVRYLNEADAVADWGGCLVRVDRDGAPCSRDVASRGLEGFSGWDFHIGNNGSLDDLRNAAASLVDELLHPCIY